MDYVDACYHTQTYFKAYENLILPMNGWSCGIELICHHVCLLHTLNNLEGQERLEGKKQLNAVRRPMLLQKFKTH
ncbi:unnamed protein product [Prunus armeniaca]